MGAYFKADCEEHIGKKPTNYLQQFLNKVCLCLGLKRDLSKMLKHNYKVLKYDLSL
jgi:hypothetical protein